MGTSKEMKRLALKMHKPRLGYASPKLYNGRFFIFHFLSQIFRLPFGSAVCLSSFMF